ncbi:MFS transporter [Cupriavidus metallidurans]|uniref:MFS transporter n=1 Tax=Cupriavidus TaxID=106589 RepID=UPI000E7F9CFD|nr:MULTISPECIES: MFS transporter [unclassified Cupriavidus]GMG91782.1 putative MFS-type transporter YdeR [Cupriavidus sp. TKC]HBD35566.1 MFS transporter [Cupriavidus sp.]HBO80884.1 MFS transporter [Cupriavidus sp.]
MTSATAQRADAPAAWITPLLATACGMIVANLYYAQPLVGPIARALQLSPEIAGLIVTLIQIGYCVGLLLLVPLGDIVENRKLVLTLIAGCAVALVAAALATHASVFLIAGCAIGLCSVAVQVLVPFAAHLAPEHARGRAVGNVTSGLLMGIMLARPVSSLVADLFGWHTIFAASAVAMVLLGVVLSRKLPQRQPAPGVNYVEMLGSMGHLLRTQPVLRRRAMYQASMFGVFSLFWTTTPLYLAGPAFHMSQTGIAVFALVGVAGAIAAPMAGRYADRGHSRQMTAIALALGAGSFLLSRIGAEGSLMSLVALTVAAIVLDFAVSANLVIGQRAIFSLSAEHRSRLNGLYMAIFFVGGAIGSSVGAWAYARAGWPLASWIGFALPAVALLYFRTEPAST